MGEEQGIRGARRCGWRYLWVGLFFFAAMAENIPAQKIGVRVHRLYLREDTLMVDIELDNIFPAQILEAVESGMTTSITLELRLESQARDRIQEKTLLIRLDHDIWEGQYRIIRHATPSDTLNTDNFEVAKQFCSYLSGIPLGASLPAAQPLVLFARVKVDPISPEQQQRTRKWLNILSKGSLIELFVSLDRPFIGTRWMEIQRFNVHDLLRPGPEIPP